jgi:prepilin peptidase CpaA
VPDPTIHWTVFGTLGLLAGVLITAAVTDCLTGKVPNRLTYPAVLLGIGWAAVAGWLHPQVAITEAVVGSLIGLAAGFIPFAVIFAAGGLGGGDVKLMAAVGAISASWQCVLSTAFYAFVIGAVLALIVMVRRGLFRRTISRLLGAAMMASARVSPTVTTEDSPRIPFALAIGIGGLLAGAEVLLDIATPWRAM